MKKILILLGLLVFSGTIYSQIKSRDLIGTWIACNDDNSFYRIDTIILSQDLNYQVKTNCCNFIKWNITSNHKIKIEELFICTEPGRISSLDQKERYSLRRLKGKQIVTIKRNNEHIGRYVILEYDEQSVNQYPHIIKTLKLHRIF